jgi:hypothetical protein
MKSISLVLFAAAVVCGCSMNSSNPTTAWGKNGVSLLDYRTDSGQCQVIAATRDTEHGNGANTAGGINGSNNSASMPAASGSASASSATSGAAGGTPAAGTYRDSANPDFVNRAAMQQRSVEMAEQRARNDALKSCLSNRGYTEFELTAEQRAELAKLPQGSDERRAYLFKLGTDPQVLSKQAVKHSAPQPAAPAASN